MARDALVVGINRYQYQALPHLNSPALDAEAIAVLLEQYGDFRVTRLPEAINPEKQPYVAQGLELGLDNLEKALEKLFIPEGRSIPDTALFYFSGHGLRKKRGVSEGFLASSDCDPQKSFWGLSLRWLRELLEASPIKQQIVLLDCCHSGELFNFNEANPGDRGLARDRCFIAASREFEAAQASLDSEYSVFTKVLLEGLKPTGIANITNLSLVNYINQNWGNGTQRPIYSNFGESITITTKLSSDITKSSNEIAHQNSLNLSEKSVRILVISQLGRGQYRTISEAINDAQDGDKIVVKEGIYREGLVINKPLEIIGDGEKSKIILESDNSPCVLMKTDYAIVKGLTLCGRARLKGKNYNTIDIPQGFLILEDCDITSDSLACIAIYGSTTRANISFCKIHNSWNSGLYVCNRGHAIVKNCDIFANHPAGIQISTLGNSTIQDCSIKNNLMGIWLYDIAEFT